MGNRPRHIVGRTCVEPSADLTEHRIVHRAMRVDLGRLALAAADIESTPRASAGARWDAFREYLSALIAVIESHLRVDTDSLAPLLIGVVGAPIAPPRIEPAQLIRPLHLANSIARGNTDELLVDPDPVQLATALLDASRIAGTLIREQERDVFPLIRRHVRVIDYRWLQDQYRADLPSGLLAFLVPWTIRHATEPELRRLLDPKTCVTHKIFRQRFEALERQVFGVIVGSGGDQQPAPDMPGPGPVGEPGAGPFVDAITAVTAPSNTGFPRGVGAPAVRALVAAGYTDVMQLAGVPAGDVRKLHGMGPKALALLQAALEARGQTLG